MDDLLKNVVPQHLGFNPRAQQTGMHASIAVMLRFGLVRQVSFGTIKQP